MKLLPRYTFRSGELCPHGDPDCLCDVVIPRTTPIDTKIHHMFHQLALQELGDYGANSRNVVEFFAIVLGCYETFRREVGDGGEDATSVWSNVPPSGREGSGPPAWQALPDTMKVVLRRHASVGTPWSYAAIELEDAGLSEDTMRVLRRYYGDCRRNAYHTDKQRSVPHVLDCVVCNAPFTARVGTAIFCSTKCKMVNHRKKLKGMQ